MNLDFSKLEGLLPGIVVDHGSGRVLMLGFLNEEAWRRSVESGYVTFYSRSRKKLWMKGETSGHRLAIREIRTDCDQDALEFRVEVQGPGVCHEGFQSCFFRRYQDGDWRLAEEPAYDPKGIYSR